MECYNYEVGCWQSYERDDWQDACDLLTVRLNRLLLLEDVPYSSPRDIYGDETWYSDYDGEVFGVCQLVSYHLAC